MGLMIVSERVPIKNTYEYTWTVYWRGDSEKLTVVNIPWSSESDAKRWRRFLIGLKGKQFWKLGTTDEMHKLMTAGDIQQIRAEAERLIALLPDQEEPMVSE